MEGRPTPPAESTEESEATTEAPVTETSKEITPPKPNEAKPHRRSWLRLFRGK